MIMAGLAFEYDVRDSPDCTYKIGEIPCEDYPEYLPCAIFATKQEAIEFRSAHIMSMGTGWLVHCAQQTQRIHENMVTRMLALHQDLNHTIRML